MKFKHPLPDPGWPTQAEAQASRWFSPIQLGPHTARTRTWVPAMVPWRATEDGEVTRDVIDWYARFAEGRPGVIVVEATGIRDVPSGPLLRIGHDRFIPGLRRLVEAVREASHGETLLLIQIIDFLSIRRRPDPEKFFSRFLELTGAHRAALGVDEAAPEAELRQALLALDHEGLKGVLTPRELEALEYGARERVTDVHLPHIAELPRILPRLFADAAERAFAAGFHGVELHYAHAYTMASFLSRRNDRADGYGGSREGRVRLPVEVLRAVRERVGPYRLVGLRYLGDEAIEGGSDLDDACWFAPRLVAAGADFLSVSKGGKFEDAKQPKVGWAAYPYTGPSGHECMPTVHIDERGPFGRNLALPAAIRRAVREAGHEAPVIAAGGISSFTQAEAALERGDADIIAAARQSLADPDWFAKIEAGRGAEVRRCQFTNYCEALDQQHKVVTCQLWDRTVLDEPGIRLDPTGRRRLIAPRWTR